MRTTAAGCHVWNCAGAIAAGLQFKDVIQLITFSLGFFRGSVATANVLAAGLSSGEEGSEGTRDHLRGGGKSAPATWRSSCGWLRDGVLPRGSGHSLASRGRRGRTP